MKTSMYTVGLTVLATVLGTVLGQNVSPCPSLFRYDPKESKPGQWAGVLTLLSEFDLNGIWVRVIFDKQALDVGSPNGETECRENNEFLIQNRTMNMAANSPTEVRFTVKYNPEEQPPKLIGFRLNARTVCPGDDEVDTSCGKITVPNPLNMDEQATHAGEFPWHVALYRSNGYGLTFLCGGSLVNRNTFVTAAHCVFNSGNQKFSKLEDLSAVLGKSCLNRWSDRGIQIKQIQSVAVHPAYDPATLQNDIAIVKLSDPVAITTLVRPVCLWDSDHQNDVTEEGTVVGWGYDSTGEASEGLIKAKMIFDTKETCEKAFPDYFGSSSDKAFCASYKQGTSICNCQAGSGLTFPRKSSTSGNTAWQLRGVALSATHNTKCDLSLHTAFIDVAKYLDWIHDNLK